MKLRRILAVMLALSMFLMVACSGNDAGDTAPADNTEPADATEPAEPDEGGEADDNGEADDAEPAGDVRVYKLADNHPDGYPTVLGDLRFAELVEERTGGSIKIEVYNNAVLGDEKTAVEQTQMGDIQFIRVGTNLLSTINPIYNALSMPFLYRDKDHLWAVLDGEIGNEFMELAYDNGLLGLCWFDAGSRNMYNSVREIHTPADMDGLKIRVQETALMMDLITALGGSPTPMAYDEIYSGVQNGIIEGAENNWPSYMSQSHNEVAPFFTVDEHVIAPEMILVNTATWESFTEEEQEIIRQAALEAATYQREEWARQEAEYEQEAIAAGATVTYLTAEEKQLFADAVQSIYEQEDYAEYAEVIERIRAA